MVIVSEMEHNNRTGDIFDFLPGKRKFASTQPKTKTQQEANMYA
jgi:hypothetical protein